MPHLGILAALFAWAPAAAAEERSWVRTAVEEAAAIGAGAVWYWVTPDKQVADWDYPSVEQRFSLDVWRFDNNTFATNFVWHPFGGTAYHVIARSNGFGVLGAVGWGLGTSLAWEYLLEFREKVSINDVIVSSGSGVAAGEFAHWLGVWLANGPRTTRWNVARWTFGVWHALHEAVDRRPPELYFIWHRFEGGAAAVWAGSTFALQLHAQGRLVALPRYRTSTSMRRFFADGGVTQAGLRTTVSEAGIGHDFFADTILLGLYLQHGDYDGVTTTIAGCAIGYQYRRDELGDWTDRLALMHLPGLALEQYMRSGEWEGFASVRAHFDFAGIDSATYAAWEDAHPDVREKTILRKQGYWYGWGGSARVEGYVRYSAIWIGASYFAGTYRSQQGLDRSQEVVDTDVSGRETVTEADGWLRIEPIGPTFVLARFSRETRFSRLGVFRDTNALDRWTLETGARF